MVSSSTAAGVAAAALVACGGAAVMAAAASSSGGDVTTISTDPSLSSLTPLISSLARVVASSSFSSAESSSYYAHGSDVAEAARVVVSGEWRETKRQKNEFKWPKGDEVFMSPFAAAGPSQNKKNSTHSFPSLPIQNKKILTVGAGAVLGVSAYVLALASAPLLVSLPREGNGSLRVAAARCASAVLSSAASSRSSAMVSF